MPSRSAGPLTQDWEPVVVHKSRPKAQALSDQKTVNQALRSGVAVETVKKAVAGTNKKAAAPAVNARKLDEETEPGALARVGHEVRQAIQKARIEKKMSQAELGNSSTSARRLFKSTRMGRPYLTNRCLERWRGSLVLSLGAKVSNRD